MCRQESGLSAAKSSELYIFSSSESLRSFNLNVIVKHEPVPYEDLRLILPFSFSKIFLQITRPMPDPLPLIPAGSFWL